MKFVIVFLTISSLLLGAVKLFAYSSGPPNGYHGQSINCTSCHSGSAINTMSMVSISGLPEKYQPNTSYPLTLSLSGSNSRGFGFQLAVRSGNSNVGTLSTSQSGIRVDSGYLEHTTRLNSTVSFDWVSPSSSSGDVNFWVSSLATGGSSGTSGDQTYIYNKSLSENISTYSLSLTTGTGGSVSGAGIFNQGSTPSIVATPNTGYDFTGWTGDGTSNSGSSTTTVSMTQDRSLTANFSLKSYNLSLSAGTGGSVSGNGSFTYNSTPSIVATPDTGYDFTGWTGDGTSSSGSSTTTVSMTQDRSLTANFSLKSYTLSLSAGTGGSVSGAGSFIHGQQAIVQATAQSGFTFDSWAESGVPFDTNPSTMVLMDGDKNLTANFISQPPDTYSLILSSSPESAGTTKGAGSYDLNSSVSITATPNTGYQFSSWVGTGDTNNDANSTTVIINQDLNLTAKFSLKSYSLSVIAGTGGSVKGTGYFDYGTTQSIVATPALGYVFTSWLENGVVLSDLNSTTILVDRDRNVTAQFSPREFALNLVSSGGGSVSGSGNFIFGTVVSFIALPEDGYTFSHWTFNDHFFSNSSKDSIQVSSNITLTAKFEMSLDPALSNAQSLGNNTYSSWLGDFIPFVNGWYYHLNLGWIFPQGETSESLWFWIPDIGWFWTNQSIYGNSFLWSEADNDWVFIQEGKTVGDTLFYSYKESVWNYLDLSGIY